MTADEHNLEGQFISHEAERRLSEKLNDADQIDVDIKTDILKIFQGKADEVVFAGQGLLIEPNIRIQEIQLQTDNIAINPLSAIFGQIELNEPINAIARLVMTPTDITHALNSEYSRNLVRDFQLNVDGEIISFELEHMELFLPGNGRIGLNAKQLIKSPKNTRRVAVTLILQPRTRSHPIMLESVTCTEGTSISLNLIFAFIDKLQALVNLPYLKWEDIAFRIIDMKVLDESIRLLIETNIKQIKPSQIEYINELNN